eukprot:2459381-Karenia_brevis.AAC.1
MTAYGYEYFPIHKSCELGIADPAQKELSKYWKKSKTNKKVWQLTLTNADQIPDNLYKGMGKWQLAKLAADPEATFHLGDGWTSIPYAFAG